MNILRKTQKYKQDFNLFYLNEIDKSYISINIFQILLIAMKVKSYTSCIKPTLKKRQ